MSEYLQLIKQHLDMEYKIVCEPTRKLHVGCCFSKMCFSLTDTNHFILYCSVYVAYTCLGKLRVLLQLPMRYHYEEIIPISYFMHMNLVLLLWVFIVSQNFRFSPWLHRAGNVKRNQSYIDADACVLFAVTQMIAIAVTNGRINVS